MANTNCSACEDLRQTDPNLIVNGFTDTECASLKNDTGLVPSSGHNDCTDLENLNDCLVGNMQAEVEAYDVCDWKAFMKKFIPNVWTTLKGIICAICGIWTNIHNLWSSVRKLNCILEYLNQSSVSFHVDENVDGDMYAVAGKGVSFLEPSVGSDNTTDLHLDYIAGGLMRGGGSYKFHTSSFDEPNNKKVKNFDNGSVERTSYNRQGNTIWGNAWTDATRPVGGELICEFRLKNTATSQILAFFPGFGQNSNNGCFTVRALVFAAGKYAYGQHGSCLGDGTPSHTGYDSGHIVPTGWTYIQLRMSNNAEDNVNGKQLSPTYFMGVRTRIDQIPC